MMFLSQISCLEVWIDSPVFFNENLYYPHVLGQFESKFISQNQTLTLHKIYSPVQDVKHKCNHLMNEDW